MALNREELKNFLLDLEKFYQPEDLQAKDGIGHEIEHIKGTVRRSTRICNTINAHLGIYEKRADPIIAASVACLHDVGNLIARKGHNFFGEAIFSGDLTAKHVVKHMMDKASYSERQKMSELVDKLECGEIDIYDIQDEKLQGLIENAYKMVVQYNMAMHGFNGQDVTPENIKPFLNGIISNRSVCDSILPDIVENGKLDKKFNIPYKPELKKLSDKFHDVFKDAPTQKNQVLAGIREHNIDFEMKKTRKRGEVLTRYVSPFQYSRIIADADKDNVAETFAIRTMLYAENVFGKTEGKFMIVVNGKPEVDIDKVCRHVLHQARERFGFSQKEWEALMGKGAGPQPIFREAFKQLDPDGYKNIDDAKFYRKDVGGRAPWEDGTFDKSTPEKEYVNSDIGDDIFSQVDAHIKNTKHISTSLVSALRNVALDKCRDWSRVDREQESLKELRKIYLILQEKPSIEAAVDHFESQFYKNDDMTFREAVMEALYPPTPELLKQMTTAQTEHMDTLVIDINEEKIKEEYTQKDKDSKTVFEEECL